MRTTVPPVARPMSLLQRIEVRVLDGEQRLYRVCRPQSDDGFLDAFRSHYELGRPPRGPEDRAAVLHMALSMFDRIEVARDLAERVPRLGGHVAVLDLRTGLGMSVAKTGGPAHWSVWGRPAQLVNCVARVAPASELGLS